MSTAPELIFVHKRDTKNWGLYLQEGKDMNKVYLPKGLPKRIKYIPYTSEVAHAMNPEPQAPRGEMEQ